MTATVIEQDVREKLRAWLQRVSGILVPPERDYLFKERLGALAHQLHREQVKMAESLDLNALARQVLGADPLSRIAALFISAMTTNESTWFRDVHPFEFLATTALPDAAKGKRRIWSAASSYGQEIYSIAMLLSEGSAWAGPLKNWHLFATDIDQSALRRAIYARYRDHELRRGLSEERQQRYFSSTGTDWQLTDALQQAVSFDQRSLLGPWPAEAPWDIILCRNVLIYFSEEDRQKVLRRLTERLVPGGLLFLGAMEIYPDGLPGMQSCRTGQTAYWQKI